MSATAWKKHKSVKYRSVVLYIKQQCIIIILSIKQKQKERDKNIMKTVIADNQIEIPRYKVIPRDSGLSM